MNDDELWAAIDAQRLRTVTLLEDLTPVEWDRPSLCDGWRVRDVAGHLTLQQKTLGDGLKAMIRHPGGVNHLIQVFTPIIAISTQGEPSFTATAEEAYAFVVDAGDVGWRNLASTTSVLAALVLIWFIVGLGLLLARAEGNPPWRSIAAGASGMLLTAYLSSKPPVTSWWT